MANIRRMGAVLALVAVLTPHWEGMDLTAKPDRLANGLITFCTGLTTYDYPDVKAGDRFTIEDCRDRFKKTVPKYIRPLEKCVHNDDLTDHQWSALIDAAFNAGPTAVCKSPMVRLFNAHDPEGACKAYAGWYEKSGGAWRKGLANRRHLDPTWSERVWCMTPDKKG